MVRVSYRRLGPFSPARVKTRRPPCRLLSPHRWPAPPPVAPPGHLLSSYDCRRPCAPPPVTSSSCQLSQPPPLPARVQKTRRLSPAASSSGQPHPPSSGEPPPIHRSSAASASRSSPRILVGWLKMDIMLPFKVGDTAESRSFSHGFRGAWFRSKINLIFIRQGHLECLLEYLDFPDEKKTWTRLYKVPPGSRKLKSSETRMIMVRPTFPLWYLEHEKPDQLPKANVVAIVSSPWKVGDLIEWWYTDCYWTGKIIELLGDDKVKIALHEEPIGEGGYYDADCKDLRPALDWSLEKGWSVPLSQENGKSWYTAQLIIESTDSGSSSSDEDIEQSCDGEEVQKCLDVPSDVAAEAIGSGTKLSANFSDEIFIKNQGDGKEESLECLNGPTNMPKEVTDSKGELPPNQNGLCCIESETNSPIAKRGEPPEALSGGQSSPISLKRWKTFGDISVEAPPDIVDDAIVELEKVANKIKRLESLMLSVGSPPSKVAKLSWKFLEDASAKHQ